MYPAPQYRSPHRAGHWLGSGLRRVIVIAAVGYLALSAYSGYALGRQIYEAKSTNPFVAIGSGIAGREATESFAIQTARVPSLITMSPTFWLALRMTE